jgi:hypothetical protein
MKYNYRHFHAGHVVSETARDASRQGPAPGTMAPDVELRATTDELWRLREHCGRSAAANVEPWPARTSWLVSAAPASILIGAISWRASRALR